MPAKVRRECSQPGCRLLTTVRYCSKHSVNNADAESRRQYDRDRADDPLRKHYKTVRWATVRKHVLFRDPLCKIKDCNQQSTVVDHVIPAREYSGDFYDEDNLQGLCKAHHDVKTATQDSNFARRKQ